MNIIYITYFHITYFHILFLSIHCGLSSSLDFFRHWQCIGIKENIDFSKPYKANIGEFPLVVWKGKEDKLLSNINICKHMGSRLDNGKITEDGCLKCQYHGLEFSEKDTFGKIIEQEGKMFWAVDPIHKLPYKVPFFNDPNYEHSLLQIDMDCSLTDSAYNTMDLRHPEYVHNSLFGFGNDVPPTNIKQYKYPSGDRVGLSFDYVSNGIIRTMNDNVKTTNNFHMYIYPTFSWSKVSFDKKDLIIGVNLLPLENRKTRWYITLVHNYYNDSIGKNIMKLLSNIILNQDFKQMKNQFKENKLKQAILFDYMFKDEEILLWLNKMFEKYEYPDIEKCIQLHKKYKDKSSQ